jgi:hypothetical protein
MLFDEMKARLDYAEYEERIAALLLERRALRAQQGQHLATRTVRQVSRWVEALRAWGGQKVPQPQHLTPAQRG